MIYLDYNATAPMLPAVKNAMLEVIGKALNPSSIHADGRQARKLVEEARRQILQSVNAEELIFCGSATEANNLALHQTDKLAVSAIEHESIYKFPGEKEIIQVNGEGIIDLKDFESKIRNQKSEIISIMLANNETGVIQPIKQAAEIAHKYGALIHCDAVQAYGRIDIDFKDLGIDMMTITSHKAGGPLGAAALIYKKGLEIKPLMFGGGQEKNRRPGTENVAAIIGFGAAAKNVSRGTEAVSCELRAVSCTSSAHSSQLTAHLEQAIKAISPEAIIHGKSVDRLPNTSCISMPGMASATQLIHFDSAGISVSAGSACSSGKVEVSRVLKAMNAPMAANAIRVSSGWATTKDEIDNFIKSWRELYSRTKS